MKFLTHPSTHFQHRYHRSPVLFIIFIYGQRLVTIFISLILFTLIIHLVQTGRFLCDHFFASESVYDTIHVDMSQWQETHRIPRSIHQIWISSTENREMTEPFRKAAQTCRELHPNYNYTLWTHAKLLLWLEKEYPWFLSTYKNYQYDMQRIDAMKYFLLFHFGGIYIDLDIKCHVPDLITAMIPPNRTENEPSIIFHMGTEGISANTDMVAAKASHPLFKLALQRLKSANRWFYLYHLTIILSAGPTYLYGIYRQYPWKEKIYFLPNNVLWGRLISGVGGATWYGADTLLIIYLMEHQLASCVLIFLIILCLFFLMRFSSKMPRSCHFNLCTILTFPSK